MPSKVSVPLFFQDAKVPGKGVMCFLWHLGRRIQPPEERKGLPPGLQSWPLSSHVPYSGVYGWGASWPLLTTGTPLSSGSSRVSPDWLSMSAMNRLYYGLFIHSPFDGHLGRVQFGWGYHD